MGVAMDGQRAVQEGCLEFKNWS